MTDYLIMAALFLGMITLAYIRVKKSRRVYRRMPDRAFPAEWRTILEKRVPFYNKLNGSDKRDFQQAVHIFLLNFNITGRHTKITDLDRILIAAAAVIPTFRLKNWHYKKLNEVVVYPDKFLIPETDKKARGLVGWGGMEGQMWLSRRAIYEGFHIENDQKNVAIHEFIHLMDMQDGLVDGVLEELMKREDILPWLALVKEKSAEIRTGKSEIREYAKTSPVEFLAASGEFYFESPELLESKHPDLFKALDKIFNPKANWYYRE